MVSTTERIRTISKGMTTEKWLRLPLWNVFIADLVYLQPLDNETGCNKEDTSWCGDTAIHVLRYQDILFVEDGHNRCAKAVRRGDIGIQARILWNAHV